MIKALLEDFDEVDILLGISFTTRKPRSKEKNGQSYYFISKEEFQKKIDEGDFLESAEVFGNYYGTSKEWVSDKLHKGHDVMLELDWQGALQVKKSYPEAITVFVLPPSIKELEVRLKNRRQDSRETISNVHQRTANDNHCTASLSKSNARQLVNAGYSGCCA